ncbi:DUF3048 domain-containing protein [Oceanobacillus sp. CAU 1775]
MKKVIYLLLVFTLLLVGCSKDDQQAGNHEPKEVDRQNKGGTTVVEGKNIYPLTGIHTDETVDNRTIGVMVNNHPAARPQTGLAEADIVFEILAEGGITRFLALYQSELPELIGPVRSAREYYFEIANDYDAVYVYHGAARFVDNMIIDRGIQFINGAIHDNDGYLFKRESFRKAPHNSYFITEAITEAIENKGYETELEQESLPFLDEAEVEALTGKPVTGAKIVYSTSPSWIVEYRYDEALERYNRYSDNVLTAELNTEEEVLVDNIFIVETYHEVIDDVGRRKVDLESGGRGILLQKGIALDVEWKSDNGKIVPVLDGNVIGFVPGKTWINFIPTSPGMDNSVTLSNE